MNTFDILTLIAEDAITSTDAGSDLFLCRLKHGGKSYAADMIAEVRQDGDTVTIETTANRRYIYEMETAHETV